MRVDLVRNSLAFAINDSEFKEVAKIKQSKTPYYLVAWMYSMGVAVSLVDYTFSGTEEEQVIFCVISSSFHSL